MDNEAQKQEQPTRALSPVALVVAIPLAAPFVVGAVILTWKLVGLPPTAGRFAVANLLGSALFSFGLALSVLGSVWALISTSACRRTLGTATALFGCSHLVLGLIIRRSIVQVTSGAETSLLPVAIPVALWAYSVWLAVKAPALSVSPAEGEEQATEEQLQPLSQP